MRREEQSVVLAEIWDIEIWTHCLGPWHPAADSPDFIVVRATVEPNLTTVCSTADSDFKVLSKKFSMAVPPPFDTTPPEDLDHNDRGPLFEGLAWFLTALATILLALRVNCKLISRRRLWWDDWTLIACWVMLIVDNILTTILVQEYGLGRHSWDLIVSDPVKFTLILSSRATITITALVWAKTAFAVTLLRLTEGAVWRFLWFIIVSMNIAMGFSAAIPWIQCAPLAKGWDTSIDGHCWAPGVGVKIWIATGAYSALMDFTLAAIPWTFLWGLQMRKKEKIGVGIAMSMGVL